MNERIIDTDRDNAEEIFQQLAEFSGDTMLRVQLVILDRMKNGIPVINELERMLIALGLSSERLYEYHEGGDLYTLDVPVSAFSLVDIQHDLVYTGSGIKGIKKRLRLTMPNDSQKCDIPLGALHQIEVLEQLQTTQ